MAETLSDQIKQARYGAVHNPFQGPDKKVLFVCSMGILRSATGARLYAHKYNTRSAGTFDEALIQVSPMLLNWADEIVFVNSLNHKQLLNKLINEDIHLYDKVVSKSKVLDIPDQYEHMHPELCKVFEEQYEPR